MAILQNFRLLHMVHLKRLRRCVLQNSLLSLHLSRSGITEMKTQVPMRTDCIHLQSRFPRKPRIDLFHERMQRHPLIVPRKPSFLQQSLRKPDQVSKAFRYSMTSTHQLNTLFHEANNANTLMRHLLLMPSHLLRSFFSFGNL